MYVFSEKIFMDFSTEDCQLQNLLLINELTFFAQQLATL